MASDWRAIGLAAVFFVGGAFKAVQWIVRTEIAPVRAEMVEQQQRQVVTINLLKCELANLSPLECDANAGLDEAAVPGHAPGGE